MENTHRTIRTYALLTKEKTLRTLEEMTTKIY